MLALLCAASDFIDLYQKLFSKFSAEEFRPSQALIYANWSPGPLSLLKMQDDFQRHGKICENALSSEGQCPSQAFSIPATQTLLQFSAQKSIFKTKMVKQGRHESTDQELDTEKFVPWHSRVVLNEMIRVAQA